MFAMFRFGLVVMVSSMLASVGSTDEFIHRLGQESDFGQYLFETQNAVIQHEHWGSNYHVDYWAPESSSTWGSVTYKYDLGFDIGRATIDANIYVHHGYDTQAQGWVEVSPDGMNWTYVTGIGAVNPPGASSTGGIERDVTSILLGSNTAYIRGYVYQDRSTSGAFQVSQFARTHFPFPGDNGYSGLTFKASSVPETSSFSVLWGLLLVAVFGRKPKL